MNKHSGESLMKKMFSKAGLVVAGALLVVAAFALTSNQAEARPNYNKAFMAKYPDLAAAKEAKCGVCHEGMDKKVRNDYGKAFGTALGKKKATDGGEIDAALDKAAGDPSAIEGKTFGDLIKDGKLPASK
jgi:hypothetical protein